MMLLRRMWRKMQAMRHGSTHVMLLSPGNSIPKPREDVRVLYQPYAFHGACGFIDLGMINGYRGTGAQTMVWNAAEDWPPLASILARFRPTHFAGYLQGPDRNACRWTRQAYLQQLVRYKARHSLCAIVNSYPSNLRDFYGQLLDHMRDVITSFYATQERPVPEEQTVLNSGFIDIMTARDCVGSIPVLYRNFLEAGLPVLSEPPAFDPFLFRHEQDGDRGQDSRDLDVLFIGHCWPFKYANMRGYCDALRAALGRRLTILGGGWPDGYSDGVLGAREDSASFAAHSGRAKINLGLHEPTQVLEKASSTNERVFKLLGLGNFVISDRCSALYQYFAPGEHLAIAEDGEDMVRKVLHYLEAPGERERIARCGRAWVLANHTYQVRAARVLQALEDGEKGALSHEPPDVELRTVPFGKVSPRMRRPGEP